MNHQNVYDNIVHRAVIENRKKTNRKNSNYVYFEWHHILPKCLGGTNEKENTVLLTAREHFICHKLLTYIYKENTKIACAFFRMAYDTRNRKVSSRDFKYAKEISRLDVSGEKNPMYKKSIYTIWLEKYGKEQADKLLLEYKEKRKGKKRTDTIWNKGKKCPETAIRLLGSHLSKETKDKIRKGNLDKNISKETKLLQSASMKGKYKNNVWIHNTEITKFISYNELQTFLDNGWKTGRK